MSIITYQSSERGKPLDNTEYGTCCGLKPEVLHWKRKQLIAVFCPNPKCENKIGVLCYENESHERWNKFRVKE